MEEVLHRLIEEPRLNRIYSPHRVLSLQRWREGVESLLEILEMRFGNVAPLVVAAVLVGSASMAAHATTVTQLTSASQLSAQDQAFAITPAYGTTSPGPSLSLTSGSQAITFSRSSGQFEIDQAGVTYGNTAFLSGTKLVGAGGYQGAGSGGPVSLAFTLPVTQFGLNIEDFDSSGSFIVSFTAYDAGGTSLGTFMANGVSGSALSFEGLTVTGDTISKISFTDSAAGGSNNLLFGNISYGNPTAIPPVASTPEPSSLVLLGSGILSLAAMARRRRFFSR